MKDPNSVVSRLKAQDRDYSVLEFLATKPRTTYLARVRNPNPAISDALPASLKEWELKGNSLEQHHGSPGPEGAGAETEQKGVPH